MFGQNIKQCEVCRVKKQLTSVLSPTQLGDRLAQIRKKLGLTQAQFAESLGMPRSALTQVELGNRSLKLEELTRLAPYLPGTLNQFLDPNTSFLDSQNPYARYQRGSKPDLSESVVAYEVAVRNPVPLLNAAKLEQVVRYLIHHVDGAREADYSLIGYFVYFIEFQHYELYETHVCGVSFVRVPHGAIAEGVTGLIDDLALELGSKSLSRTSLNRPDLRAFNGAELHAVQDVCSRYGHLDAISLGGLIQRDIPWLATADGEVIDYELAMYREFPFSAEGVGQSRPYEV